MGQKYSKRSGNKQKMKLLVLTFLAADAAGIYYAHQKLSQPVPGSLDGELFAAAERADSAVPRVISPAVPAPQQVAVRDTSPTLSPDLRFMPDRVVPAFRPADAAPAVQPKQPVPSQLAKVDAPAPAKVLAPVAQPSTQRYAATAVQTTVAKPAAIAPRTSTVVRQTASLAPVVKAPVAVKAAVVPVVSRTASSSLSKAVAQAAPRAVMTPKKSLLTSALTSTAKAIAPIAAKPVTRSAAAIHTTVERSASRAIQRNTVGHQSTNFTAAFDDFVPSIVNSDFPAPIAQPELDHVASAPTVLEVPVSASPVGQDGAAPASPAPAVELPAVAPAANLAG